MGDLVLSGLTSGAITITPPAVAGTTTLTLPAVTGTILTTTSPKAGNVLQVVSATYATETQNNTNTYADTGLTATITPTSTTSKILVIVSHADCGKFTNNTAVFLRLLRGATNIYQFSNLGAYTNGTVLNVVSITGNYLDSPATTSATTYKTQFASQGNNTGVRVQYDNSTSSITLMEIAA